MQPSFLKYVISAMAAGCLWQSVAADEQREREEQANVLRAKAAELAKQGFEAESENLVKESRKLLEKQEFPERKLDEGQARQENVLDAQHLKERLEDLRSALKTAEAGSVPERERDELRAQVAEAERKLREVLKRGEHRGFPEKFRAQVEKLEYANRRVRHIRVAAENLKAAEMHDMAHDLMQKAELMEREIHAAREGLTAEMAGGKERGQELGGEIRELRSENHKLKEELQGLRQAVEELQKQRQERQESEVKN